jgi:hypothetical protein
LLRFIKHTTLPATQQTLGPTFVHEIEKDNARMKMLLQERFSSNIWADNITIEVQQTGSYILGQVLFNGDGSIHFNTPHSRLLPYYWNRPSHLKEIHNNNKSLTAIFFVYLCIGIRFVIQPGELFRFNEIGDVTIDITASTQISLALALPAPPGNQHHLTLTPSVSSVDFFRTCSRYNSINHRKYPTVRAVGLYQRLQCIEIPEKSMVTMSP